jgi:hypothetical protein
VLLYCAAQLPTLRAARADFGDSQFERLALFLNACPLKRPRWHEASLDLTFASEFYHGVVAAEFPDHAGDDEYVFESSHYG